VPPFTTFVSSAVSPSPSPPTADSGLGEVIDQLGAVRVRERLVDDDAVAVKERSRCFVRS